MKIVTSVTWDQSELDKLLSEAINKKTGLPESTKWLTFVTFQKENEPVIISERVEGK